MFGSPPAYRNSCPNVSMGLKKTRARERESEREGETRNSGQEDFEGAKAVIA